MAKLDSNFTVEDVRYDVTNSFAKVCLLIGQQLIDTGEKDGKLVDIAGKLSDACELMRKYSDERDC